MHRTVDLRTGDHASSTPAHRCRHRPFLGVALHLYHRPDHAYRRRTHWLEDFLALHPPASFEHSLGLLFRARGEIYGEWTTDSWPKLTVSQTARKTLEEIDYIFVKGEALDRLHERMHEQVQGVDQHGISETKGGGSQTLEMTGAQNSDVSPPSKV